MVRTGERCVRVAGGKSSEKKRGTGTPSTAAGPSTSSSNSSIGGNPVCPRETPSWQKPITCFFPKIEGHGQQFIEKEMAESSKTNIPNLETVPVVAGPSKEEDQPMSMEEANDASNVQDTEKNKLPEIAKNSPDPVSPSNDMNLNEADKTHDKKNESLLATPKSEKKLESSNEHLALSKSGLGNIAGSRKRFGHDSGGTMDDTEIPAKKLKLDDALRETQPEEAAGCSIPTSYSDFSSATCPNGNESDSSGFDEYTSRKREHPDSASDANNETPKKKFKLGNAKPRYQIKEPASVYDDIIVVSSDEENSDMELDDSINFSPENPYMYMNGNSEEVANNAVDAPPPQDEVPQGLNNPMELGYAGNNDNNDNIPDNVYYPVENGFPEDDGSMAGNNSDDDPPEDSDEEETDTDIEDNDEDEDDENEDEDDQDDGGVPFYANIHFYHNHIEE